MPDMFSTAELQTIDDALALAMEERLERAKVYPMEAGEQLDSVDAMEALRARIAEARTLPRFYVACTVAGESLDWFIDAPDAETALKLWGEIETVQSAGDLEFVEVRVFALPPPGTRPAALKWHSPQGVPQVYPE